MRKKKIIIEGTHCASCKALIETELGEINGVRKVQVDYRTGECLLEFDKNKVSREKIYKTIESLNYSVRQQKEKSNKNQQSSSKKSLIIFIIVFLLFVFTYYFIKQFGLLEVLSRLNEQKIGYWLIFIIGILASFHCVGMCGGLVVAYTAQHQTRVKEKAKKSSPHFQYNLGRLISYMTIGAVLGGIGSFFAVNPDFTGTITLVAGVLVVLMGMSLLINFKWLKKIQLKTPSSIARFLYGQRHNRKPKGPFIVGLLNGFMPCGPLQAMQLYALASGSFSRGAFSMAIYAAGTIPLMFGLGSIISAVSKERVKQAMKFSGAIVIILGIFMFNRGLINFGYGFRGFVSAKQTSQTEFLAEGRIEEYQVAKMDLTYRGYQPNVLYVKKDIPVRWTINVKQMTGCTDEIIVSEYNIRKRLSYGENIIEFTPKRLGEIKFSCWMQMVWGKFIVTDTASQPNQNDIYQEPLILPKGTCGGSSSCGGSCGSVGCGCRARTRKY